MQNTITDLHDITAVQLKDLKQGEFFIISKNAKKVYSKGSYDRSEKKYECNDFNDISACKYLTGNKTVFINFTF